MYMYMKLKGVPFLSKMVCKSSGGFRGPTPAPAPYFLTKIRPEGPKKIFSDTAPPYLRVWMTPPPLSEGLDSPLVRGYYYRG